MLLRIRHQTTYRYAEAAAKIVQALRLWPEPSGGQQVRQWQVRVDERRVVPTTRDGFGNRVATHAIDRDVHLTQVLVEGEVETRDTAGVHGHDADALPPAFYLGSTPLTSATEAMAAMARAAADGGSELERLHRLMAAVRECVDYLPGLTDAETPAAAAFEAGAGVCQDHAHILAAAARGLGFPARYVSGYLGAIGDVAAASHAWCEVFVTDLGWVGFDAANRQCPDEHYVRVACGRDYRDAAPLRGVRQGGRAEHMEVDVAVSAVRQNAQ